MASGNSGIPQNSSENRIALSLGSDTDFVSTENLEIIHQIGIEMLEVSFPSQVHSSVLNDFYLLLDTRQNFRTVHELNQNQESIRNSIRMAYNNIPAQLQDNITAVKLLDYPADYDERFPSAIRDLASRLSAAVDEPFYYQSAFARPGFFPDEFDFIAGRILTGVDTSAVLSGPVHLFEPSDDIRESLKALETILNQSFTLPESIVIIPADWFLERMEAQQGFPSIISSYLEGNSVSFPMPAQEPEKPGINWPVIFLLVVWISFIIHYKHQPMYMASLPRYFFYHAFFMHDILEKRMHSATSGIVVLFQHTLLTGVFFYLIADAFISETGLQSLATHFPAIFYPGFEKLCLFAVGLVIAFFSHVISVAWLHLLNEKLQQLSQTVNLYSWPLHINLIIVTLMVYFVQLNNAHNWLIAAVIAYFMVWFFSFTIAAVDSARFLDKYRAFYLFLTVGIHSLLNMAGIILIFWLPFIYEPIKMAFLLP